MFARRITTALAAAAALTLAAGPAFADGSHFIAAHTSASLQGFDLVGKFKEAGLESGTIVEITFSAELSATYQCVNNGNHNPNDPKKTTINTSVSDTEPFVVPKNGNLTGTMSLSAPAADTVLDCPNGQKAQLSAVSWTNVAFYDASNGVGISIPGTFSAGSVVN